MFEQSRNLTRECMNIYELESLSKLDLLTFTTFPCYEFRYEGGCEGGCEGVALPSKLQ